MKIGYVFAGQGSQFGGMGQDLYNDYSVFKAHCDQADAIFGSGLSQLMFTENDALHETLNAQPALFTLCTGLVEVLREAGVLSAGACGLSLGEYPAYYDQGVFDFKTGLQTIIHRAFFMQDAALKTQGKMCALMGERDAALKLVAAFDRVAVANYNGPKQVVVAGDADAIEALADQAKAFGVKRAVILNTTGAFHTPYMQAAREGFSEYLRNVTLADNRGPLYLNTTGEKAQGDLKEVMLDHLVKPVYFDVMIANMINDGFDFFVTLGADDGLKKMIKKINKSVPVCSVYDVQSLKSCLKMIKEFDV